MATYYVATTGSDSNPGSFASPFLTLQKAANTVAAGDAIIVANGVYGVPSGVGTTGFACNISTTGSAGSPITMRAATFGGVTLDCGLACHSYLQFQNGAAYWTIQGFVIIHGLHGGIWCNNGTGSSDHITIRQCQIAFIANYSDSGTPGDCGIYTDGFATNWLVDQCQIHHVGRTNDMGNSFDHGIYTHSPSITVQNSQFWDALSGWHIQTADGSGGTIIDNTFYGPNLYSGSGGAKNGGIVVWCPTLTSTFVFRNNIFYGPNNCGIATVSPDLTSSFCDHNLVYSPSNSGMTMFDSTPGGVTVASNVLNSNPLLVNPVQGGNYNLQSGSPAIAAGSATLQPIYDFSGNSRALSADIGACEYVAGPPSQAAGYTLVFEEPFATLDVGECYSGAHKWYTSEYGQVIAPSPSTASVSGDVLSLNWLSGMTSPAESSICTYDIGGLTGFAFRYGYYEASMKWDPTVVGAWPAFWVDSLQAGITNGQFGEIDVFEGQGSQTLAYYGTVHDWTATGGVLTQTFNSNNNYTLPGGTNYNTFHTFGMLWVPGHITWYFDNVAIITWAEPAIMESQDVQLILGSQEGVGFTAGDLTGVTATNIALLVNWVRVWQLDPVTVALAGGGVASRGTQGILLISPGTDGMRPQMKGNING